MQATPEEADAILSTYDYANADDVIGRLTALFFSGQDYSATCPYLAEILPKLGQHGGHLGREANRDELAIIDEVGKFLRRLEEHPDHWQAFLHLALCGFWSLKKSEYGIRLCTGVVCILPLEALKEFLQDPHYLR